QVNELFICVFELVQLKDPMITLENMTESEKEIIRLYLVKAIQNMKHVSNLQIDEDYSREVTSGVTIFRTELLPDFLKLIKNREMHRNRLIKTLIEVFNTAVGRVWINTYQGDSLDSEGKKERRLHLLSIDCRDYDSSYELDSMLEDPKDPMPRYPYHPHPEGHYWWNPNLNEWDEQVDQLE
ncbi:hypothetical protein PENTCL1PPCAC_12273, partial [Pristionchus entomophagus]